MGDAIIRDPAPCAKGPVPYCLDEVSKRRGARHRLELLRNALESAKPGYQGLEVIFDEHLIRYIFPSQADRTRIAAHLKAHWFDPTSRQRYFPNQDVARIYADGVLKTLELSLNGSRRGRAAPSVVPINAWWIVDLPRVKMLTLAEVRDGVTVGGRVTLLILTPRPRNQREQPGSGASILGDAVAWTTEQRDSEFVTVRVNDMR
jgi:hypothetical protein